MKSVPRFAAVRSAQSSRVVSATQMARSFSELLDPVCYRGESFVIERGGELVWEKKGTRTVVAYFPNGSSEEREGNGNASIR